MPANATKALRKDWIWDDGTLWSTLLLLGPASREAWNDCPGAFKYTDAAIAAWANVNAFVARLAAEGVYGYSSYAIWAMQEALKESPGEERKGRDEMQMDAGAWIAAAAAWINVWGRQMYYERPKELRRTRGLSGLGRGGHPGSIGSRKSVLETKSRPRRLGTIAKEAFEKMEEIEKSWWI
jgi:hypothetical protein